jgi:hypothetical protein
MNQRSSDFNINAENKDKALKALKALCKKKDLGWVDNAFVINANTLEEALKECRWDTENIFGENINSIDFSGEKLGDDYDIFNAIAPYVESSSYIEMEGEDSDLWRWVFEDGECKEVFPTITW